MVQFKSFQVKSEKEFQLIRITDEFKKFVADSGVKDGFAVVVTAHTTTGIMVNEDLDCLAVDIEETLDRLVPADMPYAHSHFLPTYGATGGNAPGHLKSMLTGNHCLFPIKDGEMILGAAQEIFFAEYDGPQLRKMTFEAVGE